MRAIQLKFMVLFWSLLNVILFLFFILICFKATKLLRQNFGLLASIVFVFGILSFMEGPVNGNEESNSNNIKSWKFTPGDSLNQSVKFSEFITLEKNLISKYYLSVQFCKDKVGKSDIPLSAFSATNGFICGTNWKPLSININSAAGNDTFKYAVYGIVEWRLLAATIYSQQKEYKGILLTRH